MRTHAYRKPRPAATVKAPILTPRHISLGPGYATALRTTHAGTSAFLAVGGGGVASFYFALPLATPSNASVFGTGDITEDQVRRARLLILIVPR